MKFINLTLQYGKKNFLTLFLSSAVPAVLFSFLANPHGMIGFYYNLFSGGIDLEKTVFIDVFRYFALIDVDNALLWLGGFLVAVFLTGALYCIAERKMRYGMIRGIRIRSILKTCALVIVPMVVIVAAVLCLAGLIITGLIFWTGKLFSGLVAQLICLVFGPLIWAVVLSFLSPLVCWLPCTMIDGLNFIDSVSLSVRLCSTAQKQVLLTAYAVLAIASIALSLSYIFLGDTAFRICALVISFILCMELPVYISATYFELTQMPRLDGRRRRSK